MNNLIEYIIVTIDKIYFFVESDQLIKQFQVFDAEIYLGILTSLIILTLASCLNNKFTIVTFIKNIWNYFIVLLSENNSIIRRKGVERLLSGVWVIASTILMAAFAGLLTEQMMKPQPIRWIDSLDDLYSDEWKDLYITTTDATEIAFAKRADIKNSIYLKRQWRECLPYRTSNMNLDIYHPY